MNFYSKYDRLVSATSLISSVSIVGITTTQNNEVMGKPTHHGVTVPRRRFFPEPLSVIFWTVDVLSPARFDWSRAT
uniref:Uncharacterized protein n=1 Tax=Trichuris muris TaxID=70415 RepID=A0A5S6QNI5_TRIMR